MNVKYEFLLIFMTGECIRGAETSPMEWNLVNGGFSLIIWPNAAWHRAINRHWIRKLIVLHEVHVI